MTRADIVDALERAIEFVKDPDEDSGRHLSGAGSISAVTSTMSRPSIIAQARETAQRLERQQKTARLICDLHARLKADEAIEN